MIWSNEIFLQIYQSIFGYKTECLLSNWWMWEILVTNMSSVTIRLVHLIMDDWWFLEKANEKEKKKNESKQKKKENENNEHTQRIRSWIYRRQRPRPTASQPQTVEMCRSKRHTIMNYEFSAAYHYLRLIIPFVNK